MDRIDHRLWFAKPGTLTVHVCPGKRGLFLIDSGCAICVLRVPTSRFSKTATKFFGLDFARLQGGLKESVLLLQPIPH